MNKRFLTVLFTASALSLAACGGDANGREDAPMEDTAETMADETGDAAGNAEAEDAADAGVTEQELPEGVTTAMVEQGESVYSGAGICASCHGPDGTGIENLGADLTDDEWVHSDGDYEGIVETVTEGVTAQESSSGVIMPPRAGTNITDEQVRAASAYVWTLSR